MKEKEDISDKVKEVKSLNFHRVTLSYLRVIELQTNIPTIIQRKIKDEGRSRNTIFSRIILTSLNEKHVSFTECCWFRQMFCFFYKLKIN